MRQRSWKTTEIKFLRKNYASIGAEACAEALGRSKASVYEMARRNGIRIYCRSPSAEKRNDL